MKNTNKILLFIGIFLLVLIVLFVIDVKRNLSLSFNGIQVKNVNLSNDSLTVGVSLDIYNDTFFSYDVNDISAFVYDNDSGLLIGQTEVLELVKIEKGYNELKFDINNVSISQNINFIGGNINLKVKVFLKIFGITNSIEKIIEV